MPYPAQDISCGRRRDLHLLLSKHFGNLTVLPRRQLCIIRSGTVRSVHPHFPKRTLPSHPQQRQDPTNMVIIHMRQDQKIQCLTGIYDLMTKTLQCVREASHACVDKNIVSIAVTQADTFAFSCVVRIYLIHTRSLPFHCVLPQYTQIIVWFYLTITSFSSQAFSAHSSHLPYICQDFAMDFMRYMSSPNNNNYLRLRCPKTMIKMG